MGLFSKFRQWHNGGLIEKKPVDKPRPIQVCEAVKALGIENMKKLFTPTAKTFKPRITVKRVGKSQVLFWSVSDLPERDYSDVSFERWNRAYEFAAKLNWAECAKIEAERLAKKEKEK